MNLTLIQDAIDAYVVDARESDRARLNFFKGLFEIQEELAELVGHTLPYEAPSAEQIETWYWSQTPVLSQAPASLTPDMFARAASQVCDYFVHNAGLTDDATAALASVDWHKFAASANLNVAAKDPTAFLAGIHEAKLAPAHLAPELFIIVISCALRPFMEPCKDAIMAKVTGRQDTHSKPLFCPVCGSISAASYVGEDAGTEGLGRAQYCAQCGCEWEFERIRCGRCGSANQRHLHYFNTEDDPAHRLQSCDECGGYQRVTWQDDLKVPLCMEVEDVIMARLDRIALDPRFADQTPARTSMS